MFVLRWGVAVAGIAWVLANTSFQDRLLLVDRGNELVAVPVLHDPPPDASRFEIYDTRADAPSPREHFIDRDEVWTRPGQRTVKLWDAPGKIESAKLLAIRPGASGGPGQQAKELLVRDPNTRKARRIGPQSVVGGYSMRVPYPLVDIGLIRLVKQANLTYFIAALLLMPLTYLITSRRWHLLLEAMDIHLTQSRTFVINMVGAFYNTFMPGSTGGDLIKAYYAAKHTTHKVRAVLSVIVDRVIGLLALIVLGGVMASIQWHVRECQHVAIACGLMILMTIVGLVVFYHPTWRRLTGLDWLLKKLPMQRHVHHAVEAMELYGKRPVAAGTALVMTFPVHIITIISATLAGLAFGLKMNLLYYWTVVPVLALVGAIPISPQGVGVMESFAVVLTARQGVTVSQAIALAMSIRIAQMLWNLVAGIFVLRGGYHAPTESEQEEMEQDDDEPDAHGTEGNASTAGFSRDATAERFPPGVAESAPLPRRG